MEPVFPCRINKYLAHTGVCSRREADELIAAGRVLIDGRPAALGSQVTAGQEVEVLGSTASKSYLAYYKGRGVITHSPAPHEVDIVTKLNADYGLTGLFPVGRLDKDSEGLMLLTNDGRITGPLLDPAANHEKEYDVMVDKPINNRFLQALEAGVTIEGYTTKPAVATAHPRNKQRFTLILTEGKKHQIRRMCAALGYQVQQLKRTRIMHITLGKLKPNQYRKLSPAERTQLLHTLGISSSHPSPSNTSK